MAQFVTAAHTQAFKELITLPNWVSWQWQLKQNKEGVWSWTKPPYRPQHPSTKAKNDDPDTWGSYQEALDAYQRKLCEGIGFCILNTSVAAFDLDDCRDPATGNIDPQAMAIVQRCNSYVEISVSGTGLHVIGLGDASYTHRKQKIPNTNMEFESYSNCGRYIVVTGNQLPGTPDCLADISAVVKAVVAELDGPKKQGPAKSSKSRQKVPQGLRDLISSPPEGDLSNHFHHAVCWLKELGYDVNGIESLISGQPIVPDRYNDRLQQEIGRCLSKARPNGKDDSPPEAEGAVRLEDFHAYMPMHQYIFSPTREMWPAASVNQRITLDSSASASQWLDRNKPVEQATWAPGEPMIIEGKLMADGGWIHRSGVSCFNMYRPPVIVNGDATQAGPWIDHVHKVFGDDADHIIKWLAQRVQRPHEKINHALVLGGSQGIGKDTILEPIKEAVGPWNFMEAKPQQMLGNFNSFIKSVILRISEARDLGDMDRYAFYDHMKVYTTAPPDVLRVNEKHMREYQALNVCGVIITTNYRTDAIYLPEDDRRHFVAWAERTREDFEDGYWNTIYRWYREGGTANVAAYLRSLDISGFDPKAPPPKTEAFHQIVNANMASETGEIADAIDGLGTPDAFTLHQLTTSPGTLTTELVEWLKDRKNRKAIPHRLEDGGYVAVRNQDASDGLWRINGRRQTVYAKKSLSLRDQLAAARKLT
jgi:hypothetical protein